MSVKFYKLDAFTTKAFTGNPAAVVVLQSQPQFEDDILLQKIGTEFNLPATAMLLPVQHTGNDSLAKYKIKWFDAIKPIPICGHGTLAASHVVFNELSSDGRVKSIEYDAGPAGTLTAQRDAEGSIILDFPACKLVGMKEAGQDIKSSVDLQQVLQSVFPNDVEIKFVGRGDRGGYVDLLVVEVKENYPLKDANLNGEVLVSKYLTPVLLF
jgi:PhzF family phenazine biosynthesis protein